MDYTKTYRQRNSIGYNKAEELFESYCEEIGRDCQRFGFDEKNSPVKGFYNLHPLIRDLPDYIVEGKDGPIFVEAKGTNKIKLKDLISYNTFNDLFCLDTELYLAFCFDDKIIMKPLSKVNRMLTGLTLHEYENDGNQYFALELDED